MALPGGSKATAAAFCLLAMALLAIATVAGQSAPPPRPRAPVVTWDIPDVDQLPDNERAGLGRRARCRAKKFRRRN